MASIQVRQETQNLLVDFYYQGVRCREQTRLSDTADNRELLEALKLRIEDEIKNGVFDYSHHFPNSLNAKRFEESPMSIAIANLAAALRDAIPTQPSDSSQENERTRTPLFKDLAETWYTEVEIEWRRSHKVVIRGDLDRILIPQFGNTEVGHITKAEILAFRSTLAKTTSQGKKTLLSNRRINKILNPLRQILFEAADRYGFRSPYQHIKQLKIKRTDADPFTLEEIKRIIAEVRPDFQNYYATRFFTGMRTAEIDGLKWQYVDFDRRIIMVRETIVLGEEGETKTDGSVRDIHMCQRVYDALKSQEKMTRHLSRFVFCGSKGSVLYHRNVTQRVWYPLLKRLDIRSRRPYQTRHTAATLWLGAGENPQWIANQLGHTTTEMLFRVYARFVPNLTRKDGSAFEKMLSNYEHPVSSSAPWKSQS